ncbi:MAG: hypothetical protein LBR11_10370 [Deltaproteobacteria bacterium]|nr:hypothetical protein [Deltaproteobacteria bacterium]
MATKYQISLASKERGELDSIAKKGKYAAQVILLALVLLFCDISSEGRGKKTNLEISRSSGFSRGSG